MAPLKILHLEDNEDDSRVAGSLLCEELGPCELNRIDTREAFEKALRDPDGDLVLMDFTLPGLDAMELLALSRRLRPDLPVVLLTGTLGEERAVACMKSGATDFVLKSNLRRLPMAVRRALEEAQERRARVEADERLSEVLESLSDMKHALDASALVKIVDPVRRVITYVNDAFPEVTGYTRDELVGTPPEFGNDELRLPEFFQELQDTFVHGRSWKGTLWHSTKSGGIVWLQTTIVPLRDAVGTITHYLDIGFDITDRVRAEQALEQSEERYRNLCETLERRVAERTLELERSNRELEAFSYSVSHDLRAPLRHIDGFAGLLSEELGPNLGEKGRHYIEVIQNACQRMSRLIEDLLRYSRLGRQELIQVPLDLGPLVDEVVQELKPACADRNVVFRIGPLPPVPGDPALMRTVFTNLLDNALKFTRHQPQAVIEVSSSDGAHGECCIRVRDNGVGFDMEHAGKLFTVFQRLHPTGEFEGSGIGLANVRRILERHNGRIWAESAPGQGASFIFSLPRE